MAKSPEEATASMIANLKEKTGKSMEEWLAIAAPKKGGKHGEIVKFLKEEHGLTHGYANLVVHSLQGVVAATEAGENLLDAQYAGAKAALRPIYDALAKEIAKFGKDVEFSEKKTYVSLRRSKQFGLVQPSTATRVDVGINLKGKPTTDRLEASGSFNAMVSHRVRLASPKDVDKELVGWLKEAYDQA
jgi:hypothetical protein